MRSADLPIEARHDIPSAEIGAIDEALYRYNRNKTGRDDGQGLAFVMRDEKGEIIAAATGYSWAGSSELKQMWVHEEYRGRGLGRALLTAFIDEARRRGVKRVWVASFDFQAPAMYEKFGFERVMEFEDWPEGHVNVILRKELDSA